MSDTLHICEKCGNKKHTRSAVVQGIYYRSICAGCLGETESDNEVSSGAAGYERRRGYEDNAQDTIQPYNAKGEPNPEFLRLYPVQARRVYSKSIIEELKRKI